MISQFKNGIWTIAVLTPLSYLISLFFVKFENNVPNTAHIVTVSNDTPQQTSIQNVSFQTFDAVTLVITSCARWNLLNQTITSFEKFNTYKHVVRKIVIDDCNDFAGLKKMEQMINLKFLNYNKTGQVRYEFHSSKRMQILKKRHQLELKSNNKSLANDRQKKNTTAQFSQLHLMNAANEAYQKLVNTDWIFHCEDDFQFYRHSFIEKSLAIFKYSQMSNQYHRWVSIFLYKHDIFLCLFKVICYEYPYNKKIKL